MFSSRKDYRRHMNSIRRENAKPTAAMLRVLDSGPGLIHKTNIDNLNRYARLGDAVFSKATLLGLLDRGLIEQVDEQTFRITRKGAEAVS